LGTKSAEGNGASGRFGAVIPIVGNNLRHRTNIIVKAMPPRTSETTPGANTIGDTDNANKPNMTNHTGMIAVRLNSIDMVVISFFWDADTPPESATSGKGFGEGCGSGSGRIPRRKVRQCSGKRRR
jgi:hypothetical protein